ncbi:hypothetical protein AK812_SmicGene45483 [Symbiodinium microadriaticum]|uniref:Uncharacterized protein n=1 Tax=Symbiodinium microadriaticum TaxID=2951 RepID=A0A1Q9BVX8_SYMMI|nr:hypothetical protein AK812_SmicGene45483 [Symbiodinium microadriaticum]
MAGGAWVVENPASSVVFKHDRLQWLLRFLKRKQTHPSHTVMTKRYVDKWGTKRFTGTPLLKVVHPEVCSQAPASKVSSRWSTQELFKAMSFGDMWEDAGLPDCIAYARVYSEFCFVPEAFLVIPGQGRACFFVPPVTAAYAITTVAARYALKVASPEPENSTEPEPHSRVARVATPQLKSGKGRGHVRAGPPALKAEPESGHAAAAPPAERQADPQSGQPPPPAQPQRVPEAPDAARQTEPESAAAPNAARQTKPQTGQPPPPAEPQLPQAPAEARQCVPEAPAAARQAEPQSRQPLAAPALAQCVPEAPDAARQVEPQSSQQPPPPAAVMPEPETEQPSGHPEAAALAAVVNTEPHDTQTAPPAAARETHEESVNPPPATAHPGTARRTPPESGRPALRPTAVKQEEGSDDDGVDTRGLRSCKGPPKQLSKQAVDRRLYRVVQPKTNGEYKVPKEVVDEYKDKDRRPKLMSMFEKLGYDPKIKHMYEQIHEKWVQTDYEFMTDADMETAGWSEKKRKAVKRYCTSRPGWIRHTKRTVFQQALEGEADADDDDLIEEMDEDCEPGPEETESISSESENEDRGRILRTIKFPELESSQKPSEICGKMVKSAGSVGTKLGDAVKRLQAVELDKRSKQQQKHRS